MHATHSAGPKCTYRQLIYYMYMCIFHCRWAQRDGCTARGMMHIRIPSYEVISTYITLVVHGASRCGHCVVVTW